MKQFLIQFCVEAPLYQIKTHCPLKQKYFPLLIEGASPVNSFVPVKSLVKLHHLKRQAQEWGVEWSDVEEAGIFPGRVEALLFNYPIRAGNHG